MRCAVAARAQCEVDHAVLQQSAARACDAMQAGGGQSTGCRECSRTIASRTSGGSGTGALRAGRTVKISFAGWHLQVRSPTHHQQVLCNGPQHNGGSRQPWQAGRRGEAGAVARWAGRTIRTSFAALLSNGIAQISSFVCGGSQHRQVRSAWH